MRTTELERQLAEEIERLLLEGDKPQRPSIQIEMALKPGAAIGRIRRWDYEYGYNIWIEGKIV